MIEEFVQSMLAALQLTITMCTTQLRAMQTQAEAGQEFDFKRFDMLTKRLVDATKEFNRHRAAELRREQFEYRRAAEMEKLRHTEQALQVVRQGQQLHAEIEDAVQEYAGIVRESRELKPAAPLPPLTRRLETLIRSGGNDPDSPKIRREIHRMLIELGALPPAA